MQTFSPCWQLLNKVHYVMYMEGGYNYTDINVQNIHIHTRARAKNVPPYTSST